MAEERDRRDPDAPWRMTAERLADAMQAAGARAGRAAEIDRLCRSLSPARDGATMVQIADAGLARIAERLAAMRILANQAALPSRGDADRAALHESFAAKRREIGAIAESTAFDGLRLLAGGAPTEQAVPAAVGHRFTVAECGACLRAAEGFERFTLDDDAPGLLDGDALRIEYDRGVLSFRVMNMNSGRQAQARAPAHGAETGALVPVRVPAFGLAIVLNDAFRPDRSNRAPVADPRMNEIRIAAEARIVMRSMVVDGLTLSLRTAGPAAVPLVLPAARPADLAAGLAEAALSSLPAAHAAVEAAMEALREVARRRAAMRETRALLVGGCLDEAPPQEDPPAPFAMAAGGDERALLRRRRNRLALSVPRHALPALRRLLLTEG